VNVITPTVACRMSTELAACVRSLRTESMSAPTTTSVRICRVRKRRRRSMTRSIVMMSTPTISTEKTLSWLVRITMITSSLSNRTMFLSS
ncbi:hypothetical protein LTR28_012712, partial [Elasticomyces elasticus]